MSGTINIHDAWENNLRHINLELPHYQFIVVCGVSGSGKSSLISDVLQKEGHRLFVENFMGGHSHQQRNLSRPKAEKITGLFPVIGLNQQNFIRSSRSTVGTMTGIYDYLRLLFARLGKASVEGVKINRSLFSFNHPSGYCPVCKGVGVEDHIDTALLIGDPEKTLREGAINLMTPNGYIIYSQVTMEELNKVCVAEGFSADIPWKDLTEAQKNVVFYGSEKIKVLFGKHPLESRLKWTGITAKPREEGYYKGMVPVMEEILKRDRNPNILKYSGSVNCHECNGAKLNKTALAVSLWGKHICDFSAMEFSDLQQYFSQVPIPPADAAVANTIIDAIQRRLQTLCKLGLGYLNCDREAPSINNGEAGRIRLASYASSGLRNVLYIFDEPSAGLHPQEHGNLMEVLKSLVQQGNTVIVADHDIQTLQHADWIVEVGPKAGNDGGRIIYNGMAEGFFNTTVAESITQKYITTPPSFTETRSAEGEENFWEVGPLQYHNLKNIYARFTLNNINVITGLSGSGKTSMAEALYQICQSGKSTTQHPFKKAIPIDSSPIGRTPRSNPATYTGLSDVIRDLLAACPEAKSRGYKKGRFSFAVPGGRCEACGGAGVQQVGMHFLGNVEVVCDQCNGKRFSDDTLEIKYHGKSIFDILELTFEEAHEFFKDVPKIRTFTAIVNDLGLGYMKLGQSSTSLSGGEAQRVKLATELARAGSSGTLYILDEPAAGLHYADMLVLVQALKKLAKRGHTLVCAENDPVFILQAHRVIDLGPGSGKEGGSVIFEGTPADLLLHKTSATAAGLRKAIETAGLCSSQWVQPAASLEHSPISLSGVTTNNLKNLSLAFHPNEITAVCGVSGAGKSSLVYSTLYAECHRLFLENNSAYIRQFSRFPGGSKVETTKGLMPAIAIQKKNAVRNPRSIIAGYTGLYELYRLMYSRLAKDSESNEAPPLSTHFSFNRDEGACGFCAGLGTLTLCDPDKLVTDAGLSLISGAMDGSKTGKFYGDPHGQYIATLLTVGKKYNIGFNRPYRELNDSAKQIAMFGCGDEKFDVDWYYKRGNTEGTHQLQRDWPGFTGLVNEEYNRKHADARGEAMMDLMEKKKCTQCNGYRLKPEILKFQLGGMHIGALTALSAEDALQWFEQNYTALFDTTKDIQTSEKLLDGITGRLKALCKAGLGYLSTDRLVGTLSGGEYQRLQIAGLVRAPLTGTLYILDEPSFGLHHKDIERISDLVSDLKLHGNTVVMVDHSKQFIRAADRVLMLGPGAGADGGQLIAEGKPETLIPRYFEFSDVPIFTGVSGDGLTITKAFANNLQKINLTISSGIFTVLTGVSGSGKSSLLQEVIYESYLHQRPAGCENITGFDHFHGCIMVEQSIPQPGKTATIGGYLEINNVMQKLFASTKEATARKWKSSHFSRQSQDGKCPECEGTGEVVVSMDFFPDASSICENCAGKGYKEEVLNIQIDGFNIYETEQWDFPTLKIFLQQHLPEKKVQEISGIFHYLEQAGLSYLTPGRFMKTLSGGELQRIKLVKALAQMTSGTQLILLDEPGGGLHPKDITGIMKLFSGLLKAGHTLVCATHDALLLGAANHVIELGPGGGKNGGQIIKNGLVTG